MTRVSLFEYHGKLYMFDKPLNFEQVWFIVKNTEVHKHMDIKTITAMAMFWSSYKKYGCFKDGTKVKMYNDDIMKTIEEMEKNL